MSIRRTVLPMRPSGHASWGLPLVCVLTALAGCVGPLDHKAKVAFVDPPRDKVQASMATERIRVSDVLQFRLPDDSTATLSGAYQVAADGTIEVRGSGKIQVAGKTMEEARKAIREALAISLAVDQAIEVYRSEYYLVTVTADGVQNISHKPVGGKITVKDALAGTPELSSKVIWIARPLTGPGVKEQVLAVDWDGIARGESNATNYDLRPGDFLFVADEPAKGVGRVFNAVTSMMTTKR